MMTRDLLPALAAHALWGNRRLHGPVPREDDPCWQEWRRTYLAFYGQTQRSGPGLRVNDAGYRVMSRLALDGRTVLEIGPGDIRHHRFWNGRPARYLLADTQPAMLETASATLEKLGVATGALLVAPGETLPLPDGSADIVLSFYSLEHIYPLEPYLAGLERILRPGGILAGAIPAEGGLAWGLGRFLTSRRWLRKNTSIDPDKIICWEHPNYCDQVVAALDRFFDRARLDHWPLACLPAADLNLILRFVYRKKTP